MPTKAHKKYWEARDSLIYEQREKGKSIKFLQNKFDLSRARIQQILFKTKLKKEGRWEAFLKERDRKWQEYIAGRVRLWKGLRKELRPE